jgi:hypothetical protein
LKPPKRPFEGRGGDGGCDRDAHCLAWLGEDRAAHYRLVRGEPYPRGQAPYPEGADYHFRSHGHELRIFLARAGRTRVEAVRRGPVEFGLLAERAGLFLIARFGPSLSFDCPYHWRRTAEATGDRTMPPASEGTSPAARATIAIVLVEAATGIVRAIREVSFSPEFTRAIRRAIADQAAGPYERAGHEQWADQTRRYSPDPLWQRCTVHCQGGA